MVTVAQLKDLNKRIDVLKDKNSASLAELKVLQGQFDTKVQTLSEMLGLQVTAENVEALYMQAQQQLEEKTAKIEELLRDLEGGNQTPVGQIPSAASLGFTPAGFGTPVSAPVGFGVPTQTAQQTPEVVAPSVANFGTGTTFSI